LIAEGFSETRDLSFVVGNTLHFWPNALLTAYDIPDISELMTGCISFWLRTVSFLMFIAAWLVTPLLKRFAFLHIRSILELKKPILTVCAVGVSAFIKIVQEVIKQQRA
jgi:hypothetical protein